MGKITSYEKLLNEKINELIKKIECLEDELSRNDSQIKALLQQKEEILVIISKVFTVKKDDMSDYRHELMMTAIDYGYCRLCDGFDCFGDCG